MSADHIEIEVAYAQADRQWLRTIRVPIHSTVDDAIRASGIPADCPELNFDELQAGIWGHPVGRDQVVVAGQRVELYRALLIDPRDARRQLALLGQTMNQSADHTDEN